MAPILAFCDYGVTNNWRALVEGSKKAVLSARAAKVQAEVAAATTTVTARFTPKPIVITPDEVVAQAAVERENALMKIILPSGRSLYDSTREEIVEFRGQQDWLIERLKPGQTPREAGITKL